MCVNQITCVYFLFYHTKCDAKSELSITLPFHLKAYIRNHPILFYRCLLCLSKHSLSITMCVMLFHFSMIKFVYCLIFYFFLQEVKLITFSFLYHCFFFFTISAPINDYALCEYSKFCFCLSLFL